MKYFFTLFITLILTTTATQAAPGNEKFVEAMKASMTLLDSARSVEDLQNVANRFERIANAEPKEWLPLYYTAFSYANMVWLMKPGPETDEVLNKAQGFLDKAMEMKKADQSELWVLQGMIYSGRIGVDPQVRSMEFGPKSGMAVGKAKTLNENNPRAWYMSAQNMMFTPKQFGGGMDKAVPMFETAMQKFDAFAPESELHPSWGREACEESYKIAKGEKTAPWAPKEEGEGK